MATGQPRGICTIDNKLSKPLSFFVYIGTPITGKEDKDATMPGKCAEPPAPATITPKPFFEADSANTNILFGVLCALTIKTSCLILSFFKISIQGFACFKSLLLPKIIATFLWKYELPL